MLNMFTTKYVDKIMISANIKYVYVKHITFITKITFLWGNYVYSPQFCYISYNHIVLFQVIQNCLKILWLPQLCSTIFVKTYIYLLLSNKN